MRDVESVTDHTTDDVLDREIADALAVNPSPEFAARVRQRVSLEPYSPAWPATALALRAAVVAGVVVTGATSLVIWHGQRAAAPLTAHAISASVTTPIRATEVIPVAELMPAMTSRVPRPHSRRHDAGPTPVVRPELIPEVLIDAREARAIRALIDGVVDGRIDLAPLLTASASPFLEVVPIPSPNADTGVPQ